MNNFGNVLRMKCTNQEFKMVLDGPIGEMTINYCNKGLHSIAQIAAITDINFEPKAGKQVTIVDGSATHEHAQVCREWLSTYFNNPSQLTNTSTPTLCANVINNNGSFSQKVCFALLNNVKFGETVSYKELAAMVDNPSAVRAVGGAMAHNPLQIIVPCHRVLPSADRNGSRAARAVGNAMANNPFHVLIPCHRVLKTTSDDNERAVGKYISGPSIKQWLLEHEGHDFKKRFILTKT